ncbi:MAG: lyase family protein, partial [Rothia dentocariosa]
MVFANSRYDLSTPVFDDWVARMMPTLVEFRREVHRTPELSFREVKTTERIMTTLPIDRAFVAKKLNFERIYANSMDAVSDRDYILEFLSAASILMVHLSRLSEEIILWCSREFSFVELDDAHCTGSSMMPQKKNP